MDESITLYHASAIQDAAGLSVRDAVLVVRDGRVMAAGDAAEVRRAVGRPDRVVDLAGHLLLPAMVNAHAHLDLSLVGPIAYQGDFIAWIESVMKHRASQPHTVTQAVHEGLRLSREAGIGWIGDIAGSIEAVNARAAAGETLALPGVSWFECLGRGERAKQAMQNANAILHAAPPGVAMGIEAHAPYSTAAELFQFAQQSGLPATHLAETLEEEQFIRDASGPFAELLRRIGRWDDRIKPHGVSPVRWFIEQTKPAQNWVAAHCNYVDDTDIALLAQQGVSVAYCPIASEYFQHPCAGRPAHRYRDMLAAGVNVCLGTDSLICRSADPGAQPLSIFDAMRRLYQRDAYDAATLLAMATTHGLRAMQLDPALATFSPGTPARMLAVRFDDADSADPLQQALLNRYPVRSILP